MRQDQDLYHRDPSEVTSLPVAEAAGRLAVAGLSWRRLAQAAAVGDLLVLAAIGIGRQEGEALMIAAVLLVAAAAAQFRRGVPGLMLLALGFTDVGVFMLPAAVSNAAAREALGAIALPASLAAMSLAGLIAAVAAVVTATAQRLGRPSSRNAGAKVATVAAGAVAAVGLALVAVAVVTSPPRAAAAPGAEAQSLTIQAAKTAFSATTLQARPGRMTVSLANHDLFWHTFTIERLGVNLAVPVGGTRSVTITVAPGTYQFICAIPGHAEAGMRGTLVVG
jgi:plastocyanin